MRLLALLTKQDSLKDAIKAFVEEKALHVNSPLIQEMLQLKINLAIFLFERLDGCIDKRKSKIKLGEEIEISEEKKKEEIEKLIESIKIYFETIREVQIRVAEKKRAEQAKEEKTAELKKKTLHYAEKKQKDWHSWQTKRMEESKMRARECLGLRHSHRELAPSKKARLVCK